MGRSLGHHGDPRHIRGRYGRERLGGSSGGLLLFAGEDEPGGGQREHGLQNVTHGSSPAWRARRWLGRAAGFG